MSVLPKTLKRKKKRFTKRNLFIIGMLAYPVLQFLIMWVFINFDSIMMTFKIWTPSGYEWAGLANYKLLFDSLRYDKVTQIVIWNSLSYAVVNMLILALSFVASYFIYKKVLAAGAFRIIFYLPSILPLVILAFAFSMSLDPLYGVVTSILKSMGVTNPPIFFGGEPIAQRTIWVFCIWAGLGYDIILFSSAMARIPKDIIEYGRLEGVGYTRELFQIVLPLVWPTFTTVMVMALMAPFSVYLQPMFLTKGMHNTKTISFKIFESTQGGGAGMEYWATFGLFLSLIGAPIILAIRKIMERCYRDVDIG